MVLSLLKTIKLNKNKKILAVQPLENGNKNK